MSLPPMLARMETGIPGWDGWVPEVGETVWMNYPDHPDPLGVVTGYVPPGHRRVGQPIIEGPAARQPTPFGGPERGRVACHPMFLLPFPFNGPEWHAANAEGRIR